MKVVAFNGSPRRGGNTEQLIRKVFEPLEAAGIETELVQLGGHAVHGCTACRKCFENQDKQCVIKKDIINDCITKAIEADGIIIGTPTYFAQVSTEVKALIDRMGYVTLANGRLLNRKVGAGVVAVRRGGAVPALDSISHLFQISGMYIAGGTYWKMGFGLRPGDVQNDEEGLRNMAAIGENMAFALRKLNA